MASLRVFEGMTDKLHVWSYHMALTHSARSRTDDAANFSLALPSNKISKTFSSSVPPFFGRRAHSSGSSCRDESDRTSVQLESWIACVYGFPWVVNQEITIILVSMATVQVVQTGSIDSEPEESSGTRDRYKSEPVCFLEGGCGLRSRTDEDVTVGNAGPGRLMEDIFSSSLSFPVTLTFLKTENKLRKDWRIGDLSFLWVLRTGEVLFGTTKPEDEGFAPRKDDWYDVPIDS